MHKLRLAETIAFSEKALKRAEDTGQPPLIQFISPGWGTAGYYASGILEQAVADNLFPAGTHMYADHPTESEDRERPVRSVKDLMAVTVEDGHIATKAEIEEDDAEPGAVVGRVQIVPQWRPLLKTVASQIGVSIRGDATDIVVGEAEGRRGPIVEGLAHIFSVDFVTRAGRGGKVLSVLESAATNRRAVGHGVTEATVNDTRERLTTLLRDAYGGENTWVWVRDFDDTTVWFEVETEEGDGNGIYAQPYTGGDDVALSGDRTEVRVSTTYVPVNDPAGRTTTEESKEDTMPHIQIEESEHRRLLDEAGRVATLTQERDTAVTERDQARAENAHRNIVDRATILIGERAREGKVEFTALECRGLLAQLPLDGDGALDEVAFATLVDEAATTKKAAGVPSSRPHGFGASVDPSTDVGESAPTVSPWGRPLTVKGA